MNILTKPSFKLNDITPLTPQPRPYSFGIFIGMTYSEIMDFHSKYAKKGVFKMSLSPISPRNSPGEFTKREMSLNFLNVLESGAELLLHNECTYSVTLTGSIANSDAVELDIHRNIHYLGKGRWHDPLAQVNWTMTRTANTFKVLIKKAK